MAEGGFRGEDGTARPHQRQARPCEQPAARDPVPAAPSSRVCRDQAERFHASDAALIVHSFSPEQASLGDYQAFLGLFGKQGGPAQMVTLGTANGIRLWAGWVQGDAKFLRA